MSGEAGGLEAAIHPTHATRINPTAEGCPLCPPIATAVRVWLTEALAAPEVVEAARRTFYAQHIHPADGEAMRAALVAAADALRAGVTR